MPPRSVFGIACLANRIVLYGGEIDPSTKGHDGAGGFSSDVYIFSETVSPFASTLSCWPRCGTPPISGVRSTSVSKLRVELQVSEQRISQEKSWEKETVHGEPPVPRGWFAACASGQELLVHGGNSESNVRLDDMYLLHTMLA